MINTRQPTGRAPWPLILIEGGEKSGKSWAAAQLSASEKVGQTYWIDLGEGAADEYGAIPGARYLVVEHDGTWGSILTQVREVREEAARAAKAGEPPVVLVIDSMTAEWDLLKDWAANRAKEAAAKKGRHVDPNDEIKIPMNFWNDATTRHRRLMTLLMTFPGIVVMTARGKEVASLDAAGRPIEGSKEYKVEGHKNLAFDSSAWVRLSRDRPPVVVGARSVHAGIRPGVDDPHELPEGWSLEGLVFDVLRCDPQGTRAREMTTLQAGAESPDLDNLSPETERLLGVAEDASNVSELTLCWTATGAALKAEQITQAEADHIARRIKALGAEMQAAA